MRRVYVDTLKFLAAAPSPSRVLFRATGTHRTLHSAMALIAGIFGGAPVTVNVAEKTIDPWRRSSALCPNLKRRMDAVRASPEYAGGFWRARPRLAVAIGASPAKSTPDVALTARCDGKRVNATDALIEEALLFKAAQQRFLFGHGDVWPLAFSYALLLRRDCAFRQRPLLLQAGPVPRPQGWRGQGSLRPAVRRRGVGGLWLWVRVWVRARARARGGGPSAVQRLLRLLQQGVEVQGVVLALDGAWACFVWRRRGEGRRRKKRKRGEEEEG